MKIERSPYSPELEAIADRPETAVSAEELLRGSTETDSKEGLDDV